ncbi:tousled-like kinase [Cordyceps javanica]|nr:tousled-like kinase [Cordyceps javanica]
MDNPDDVLAYLHFEGPGELNETVEKHPLFYHPAPPTPLCPRRGSKGFSWKVHPAADGYGACKTLRIRFRDLPKGNAGFVIGRDEMCDVSLSNFFVGNFHGALTFDDNNRLIFRDLNSRHGTEVQYHTGNNDHAKVKGCPSEPVGLNAPEFSRRNFSWILGGPDVPGKYSMTRSEMRQPVEVTITLGRSWKIHVVVPWRNWTDGAHKRKVRAFLAGKRAIDLEKLQNELNDAMCREDAEHGLDPFYTSPLCVYKELGRGGFATAFREWDVSTGNANITRFLGSNLDSMDVVCPTIYLEYAPRGNLGMEEKISFRETVSITCQCLSALVYLHSRDIVHRDIKPDNILVFLREKGRIEVKLSDFGTSKVSKQFQTFCGTQAWLAPEVTRAREANKVTKEASYTCLVDIWSLGVVSLSLAMERPLFPLQDAGQTADYPALILEAIRAPRDESRLGPFERFVADNMLVLNPDDRSPASVCLEKASRFCRASSHGKAALLGTAAQAQATSAAPARSESGPTPASSPTPSKVTLDEEGAPGDFSFNKWRSHPPFLAHPASDKDSDAEALPSKSFPASLFSHSWWPSFSDAIHRRSCT